ncbi:Rieske (2Fe-2S) protein [Actinoplanes sp. NPDC048796]|uniref:Rieske (2Fe-2S) protein n=1 Tax=unclassified Actinoplanes TaxID=2626549 RepID=UPI0033F6794A
MTDVQTRTDAELSTEEPNRPGTASTRRVVLLGAGGLGAACVLAACGTNASSTNSNGTDFSDQPAPAGSAGAQNDGTGNTAAGGAALAAAADIPEGGGIIKGDLVITQPVAGTYKAFSKVCTHAGCDVNKIDAGQISCPCHNSKFSIETGEPTSGPATKALPETKVKKDGDNIVAA